MTRPTAEHVNRMTEKRGWFQKQLWLLESLINGRWSYWQAICLNGAIGELPDWAIPQLQFSASLEDNTHGVANHAELSRTDHGKNMLAMIGTACEAKKHTIHCFEKATDHGRHNLLDLVEWWLWAFGSPRIERRPNLSERAAVTMYHEFELHRLIGNPGDWGSALCLEMLGGSKKGTAWFPTPMHVAEAMSRMTFEATEQDTRTKSVNDPCVGTGVFVLHASNYSLNLCCQDIDPLMCALTEFAGWLFVPWLVWGNRSMIREFRAADRAEETTPETEIPTPASKACEKACELADVRQFAEAGPLFAL